MCLDRPEQACGAFGIAQRQRAAGEARHDLRVGAVPTEARLEEACRLGDVAGAERDVAAVRDPGAIGAPLRAVQPLQYCEALFVSSARGFVVIALTRVLA